MDAHLASPWETDFLYVLVCFLPRVFPSSMRPFFCSSCGSHCLAHRRCGLSAHRAPIPGSWRQSPRSVWGPWKAGDTELLGEGLPELSRLPDCWAWAGECCLCCWLRHHRVLRVAGPSPKLLALFHEFALKLLNWTPASPFSAWKSAVTSWPPNPMRAVCP